MVKKNILGVGITDATQQEILEYILQSLKNKDEKYYIVTPNPEILVYATHHPDFKYILNNARLGLCDGTGVIWAGKILGKNFKERVTGTDLMENLCKVVSKQPITVGFLGGGQKIAEAAAECLKQKYSGLKVAFASPEWPNKLPRLPIDILFVAFGHPKQEEWMSKHIGKVPVKVMMGVGGAFDYISGRVPRAPKLLQNVGLEWLFRLCLQPWRLKRQLALIEFIFLVLKEKLRRKSTMV